MGFLILQPTCKFQPTGFLTRGRRWILDEKEPRQRFQGPSNRSRRMGDLRTCWFPILWAFGGNPLGFQPLGNVLKAISLLVDSRENPGNSPVFYSPAFTLPSHGLFFATNQQAARKLGAPGQSNPKLACRKSQTCWWPVKMVQTLKVPSPRTQGGSWWWCFLAQARPYSFSGSPRSVFQ